LLLLLLLLATIVPSACDFAEVKWSQIGKKAGGEIKIVIAATHALVNNLGRCGCTVIRNSNHFIAMLPIAVFFRVECNDIVTSGIPPSACTFSRRIIRELSITVTLLPICGARPTTNLCAVVGRTNAEHAGTVVMTRCARSAILDVFRRNAAREREKSDDEGDP